MKSTTYQLRVLKVIECLKQNIRKEIDYKRPSSTKQKNREYNIFVLKHANRNITR